MEKYEKVTLTNLCMVVDKDGKILVEHKVAYGEDGLILPGGHVEKNEPFVDSVIREIKEETGLTINKPKLCGVKDFIRDDGNRYIVMLYKTDDYSGELKPSDEGEVFWLSLDELENYNLLWFFREMLPIFLGDDYSEIYFGSKDEGWTEPVLK